MKTGMLWFDNDPKTALAAKVIRAVKYYTKKYGRVPNTCLVNPGAIINENVDIGQIAVRPFRSVLPGHLWIGVEEN